MAPESIFDPEGPGYDEETARKYIERHPLTLAKPEKYEGDYVQEPGAYQAWVWHKDLKDYKKHSGSLDPQNGMVLKGRQHETWGLMEDEEKKRGSEIVKENGRYYSRPGKYKKYMDQRDGGPE